jgi:hypothetical protein
MVNDEDFRVTRAGTTVGTVDYMSPEQARDATLADVRSDIYSLGCTLYHMLAGQPPFSEGGIGERVYKHLAADPPDVRRFNTKVTPGLWTVLRRMLAKHPDDRFQTPTEVIEALRSIKEPTDAALFEGQNVVEDESSTEIRKPTAPPVVEPIHTAPPTNVTPPPATGPQWSKARNDERSTEASRKRKKQASTSPIPEAAHAASLLLNVTPEQKQAAAGQFSHATEVIRAGGDLAYPMQLLLSCCKLDPMNLLYRKLLREVARDNARGQKLGWFGSLKSIPARSRLRTAKKAGDHRLVLEYGEEFLSRVPGDVTTSIDMAHSAEALKLPDLAIWLLEEAKQSSPEDISLLRYLAHLYEDRGRLQLAITQWEKVHLIDPADQEASDKIKELAVNETLSKNTYRR